MKKLEACDFCGKDPMGICVKCHKPFCGVHGTRTGRGTPICYPCLQIERSKDTWRRVLLGAGVGTGAGLVMPGIFLLLIRKPIGWLLIGVAIAVGFIILFKLIQNLRR